jgi:DNA-directed RNA polymerase subunit RPC12/RpoP
MSSSYKCLHCERTFASPYGLKRHISDKHQYVNNEIEDKGALFQTK